MPGELDIVQAPISVELYAEVNFIAARRIVAMHPHRSIGKFSKIPRPPRMIENDFLIKLFDFSSQEKKRTAARRISIIRSISSVVL